MNIDDILNNLGLDLTNPEVKRGAAEAIEAILNSRIDFGGSTGGGGSSGGGGGVEDIEIDPDLLQPSAKHQNNADIDDDIEIEDEDDILNKIKHNESDYDSTDNSGSGSESKSGDVSDSTNNDSSSNNTDATKSDSDVSDASSSNGGNTSDSSDSSDSGEATEKNSENDTEDSYENSGDKSEDELDTEGSDETGLDDLDNENGDENSSKSGLDGDSNGDSSLESDDEDADSEEDFFDEEDLLDDNMKNAYEDEALKSRNQSRKIKRERTLAAARKVLADAQSRKASPALIHELEKSIEALESLTEAVKSIKDISDEEFNLLVNRVFDAIDALGEHGLTYKTDQERELQAQEIKADLASTKTQQELSAEDIAKIRAEHQTIPSREKEANKYAPKARSSFKGSQEFLNSLYRAIALQVKVNEIQDDSWSAINRRYSDMGVLKQGKKLNELPDNKIPVIDFYFDCSSSWTSDDIKIGKKAVAALADLEEKGQIKINLYYFGDEVSTNPNQTGRSTSGWNEIVKNVISTQATNVIIMTDGDMEDWWTGPAALTYTVSGYVWYLWKNGVNAPRLPRDLKGRSGTQQFSFSAGDL
jgi:hypothetical protein